MELISIDFKTWWCYSFPIHNQVSITVCIVSPVAIWYRLYKLWEERRE